MRNHLPVPLVKKKQGAEGKKGHHPSAAELAETVNDDWKVVVHGLDPKAPPLELTVRDLKEKFPKVVVPVTLQCSGNRRNELSREVKPVKGLEWDSGAISTAAWGGVRLADVLKAAGVASQEEALRETAALLAEAEANGSLSSSSVASSSSDAGAANGAASAAHASDPVGKA